MKKKADEEKLSGYRAAARERGRKRRRNRALAMLISLTAMVAVMYGTVTLCDRIVAGMKKESVATSGENAGNEEDPDANGGGEDDGVKKMDIDENGNIVDADGNIAGVLSGSVFTQNELEKQLEDAKTQAAEDLLGEIRTKLNGGDSVMQTLRPLYPDELIVYSGGKYNFVPIDRSLKQHAFEEENLNILESGEFQYMQDGAVVSHKGIDVSRHQGTIDWNLVAQDGVEFAFIRVGYRGYGTGALAEDDKFEENIKGALAAGIKVGVYFYSQATDETEVREEADFVLEKIAPYQIECPVVFDVEKVTESDARMNALSPEERTNLTLIFCQTIENAGYKPMVYYNTEMGALLLNLAPLENYDKWFAAYSDVFYYPYDYKIWQYSQTGKVQGINGAVDLNISFVPLWE